MKECTNSSLYNARVAGTAAVCLLMTVSRVFTNRVVAYFWQCGDPPECPRARKLMNTQTHISISFRRLLSEPSDAPLSSSLRARLKP